jgi:hypothetical protein
LHIHFSTGAFAHSRGTNKTAMHSRMPVSHHHLMPETWLASLHMMSQHTDSSGNANKEKHETHNDKEPGNVKKEFAKLFLLCFCKQQCAGKNRK